MGRTRPRELVENLKLSTQAIMTESGVSAGEIKAIGISYQMHGLVCVDKDQHVLRPSIIWCDSRAVPYGQKAFETLGEEQCLSHLLNSPGTLPLLNWHGLRNMNPNFMHLQNNASGRLHCHEVERWNLHHCFRLVRRYVLGFQNKFCGRLPDEILRIDASLIADIKPTFSEQGRVNAAAAKELGLKEGTPINLSCRWSAQQCAFAERI